jgi:hypothetical protein
MEIVVSTLPNFTNLSLCIVLLLRRGSTPTCVNITTLYTKIQISEKYKIQKNTNIRKIQISEKYKYQKNTNISVSIFVCLFLWRLLTIALIKESDTKLKQGTLRVPGTLRVLAETDELMAVKPLYVLQCLQRDGT